MNAALKSGRVLDGVRAEERRMDFRNIIVRRMFGYNINSTSFGGVEGRCVGSGRRCYCSTHVCL